MSAKEWHILVIEDDPDGQMVVSTILEHLNLKIDVANTAEEAEQYLYQMGRRYDAAIVDLALPGKDGWDLLATIQSQPQTAALPCIAVTAFHTSKLREDAIKAGFIAYFAKPLDATSFARRLSELL